MSARITASLWMLAVVGVLLCICCLKAAQGPEGSDLYLSTAETAVLLESEHELLTFVQDCLSHSAQRTGNTELGRLGRELQMDLNSLPRSQDARHPLDAYVGLRRFTQHWSKYISRLEPRVAKSVEWSLSQNHIVFPDQGVLQQARRAIVRLQASYHLPPSALLASATANLTAHDLALLASEAQGLGLHSVAQDWRNLTLSLWPAGELDFDPPLTQGHSSKNEDLDELTEARIIQRRNAKFYALCQHFQNSSDISALRSERCEYRTGRYSPLSRWKTEILSTEPRVELYYDFISEREAAVIVSKAMENLTKAYTAGATDKENEIRVLRRMGKVAWLFDHTSYSLRHLTRRIQEVTGLHATFRRSRSFGEAFQVVNYGIGGHYIPHYDYFLHQDAFNKAETYLWGSGDRAATFMIYLGQVTQGGATVFPRLGIGAPPIKRAALFWYNFNPDGLPDRRSQHGGCPVIIGEKWVANKWIHEISTAMTKSCKAVPWQPEAT